MRPKVDWYSLDWKGKNSNTRAPSAAPPINLDAGKFSEFSEFKSWRGIWTWFAYHAPNAGQYRRIRGERERERERRNYSRRTNNLLAMSGKHQLIKWIFLIDRHSLNVDTWTGSTPGRTAKGREPPAWNLHQTRDKFMTSDPAEAIKSNRHRTESCQDENGCLVCKG